MTTVGAGMLVGRNCDPNSAPNTGTAENMHCHMDINSQFTVLFNNMRNVKIKSPPTIAFSLPSINIV